MLRKRRQPHLAHFARTRRRWGRCDTRPSRRPRSRTASGRRRPSGDPERSDRVAGNRADRRGAGLSYRVRAAARSTGSTSWRRRTPRTSAPARRRRETAASPSAAGRGALRTSANCGVKGRREVRTHSGVCARSASRNAWRTSAAQSMTSAVWPLELRVGEQDEPGPECGAIGFVGETHLGRERGDGGPEREHGGGGSARVPHVIASRRTPTIGRPPSARGACRHAPG